MADVMTGDAALQNFKRAAKLVAEGKHDEARKVELLPSDREVIEQRIAKALHG